MSLLNTKDLTMKFGGLTAVNNLCLEINEGEIVALIGPNGAGKTTAFNMITGVYQPTSGTISFDNNSIIGLKPDNITKKGLARTFQNIRLFKELSILDNVFIGHHLHLKANLFEAILHLPRYSREKKRIIDHSLFLLDKHDLLDCKDEKAKNLPYGMQRRLEIARALATDPKILLLDEPAAGMNPIETSNLTSFINGIRDEFKLTIFLIEHHMSVVMGISDRIYVLDHGVTIAVGNPHQIQNNERVIEAYLGVTEDA